MLTEKYHVPVELPQQLIRKIVTQTEPSRAYYDFGKIGFVSEIACAVRTDILIKIRFFHGCRRCFFVISQSVGSRRNCGNVRFQSLQRRIYDGYFFSGIDYGYRVVAVSGDRFPIIRIVVLGDQTVGTEAVDFCLRLLLGFPERFVVLAGSGAFLQLPCEYGPAVAEAVFVNDEHRLFTSVVDQHKNIIDRVAVAKAFAAVKILNAHAPGADDHICITQ